MRFKLIVIITLVSLTFASCKKKGCMDEAAQNYSSEAKKDDGSCVYFVLNVPNTYTFNDEDGNNTVSYSGQTERLNQLTEMVTYLKSGTASELNLVAIQDMFENTNDDGNGNFTFSSTKQLKDKCFASDISLFENYFELHATASSDFSETASNGQAGTLSSGSSTYLFGENGFEYAQLIEKGLMGAIFLNQATEVYLGSDKMDVDNNNPVTDQYYTAMEHHWDEAFGYFGAPIDFPTDLTGLKFWTKYCNSQNANLNCNSILMNAFLTGRAAISHKTLTSVRDEQIEIIRKTWELVSASQAITYLEGAKTNFGSDDAKFLHELSEAYAFILCLKYVPLTTRVINYTQIETLLETNIGDNLWEVTISDLNQAISSLKSIYNL